VSHAEGKKCVANKEGFVENTLNFVKAGPMIHVNFIVIAIIIVETKIESITFILPLVVNWWTWKEMF
jgi:hypothetical protein